MESHRRAAAATEAGYFTGQILPIEVPDRKGTTTFATDEQIRPGLATADMAKLPQAFAKDGTVTAGNASGACRGAALALAARLGFPAHRGDELALAVTEAASNLHKHAREGSMLLRITRDGDRREIELVTIDAGPGLRDSGAALRDGHSTSGTLGIGLGAINRLADFCDLYSVPGHGTALVARFWPAPRSYAVHRASLVRPITGETECGDVFGAAETEAGVTGVLCDGLGHGPLAATAAAQGVAAVLEDPAAEPAALVERAQRRIAGTRGGAIGIVQVAGEVIRFAGLGNIAAVILADGTRRSMLSVPGIARSRRRGSGGRSRESRAKWNQFVRQLAFWGPVVKAAEGRLAAFDRKAAVRAENQPGRVHPPMGNLGSEIPQRREKCGMVNVPVSELGRHPVLLRNLGGRPRPASVQSDVGKAGRQLASLRLLEQFDAFPNLADNFLK